MGHAPGLQLAKPGSIFYSPQEFVCEQAFTRGNPETQSCSNKNSSFKINQQQKVTGCHMTLCSHFGENFH